MQDKYVLGLNLFHSDTSACLFKNGELVSAAEEERFTRVKHSANFPSEAIKFCLSVNKIKLSTIDVIAINSNPKSSIMKKFFFILKNPYSYKIAISSILNTRKKIDIKKLINSIDEKNNFQGKIDYIDHHISHLSSSFFFSQFEDSVNVSIDGFGDFASCSWGTSVNGDFKIDEKIYFPHSLGIFYQAMTQYLGFKNYGDEYKVMGLSSYGEPKYVDKIEKIIGITKKNGFKLNLDFFIHHKKTIFTVKRNGETKFKNLYSNKLIELLGKERDKNEEVSQKHIDLAKSTQQVYENIFFDLLNNLYKKYKIKNLTLSGGCAMNSVANGKILSNTRFKNLYICPNPGDAGGSIGAAAYHIYSNNPNQAITTKNYAYLGSQFSNDEIETILDNYKMSEKYEVQKLNEEDLLSKTANLISQALVVGWFQGKMEWGARALGNRSILGDPRNKKMKDILNLKIKRRESFRPFAPSILQDCVKDWFDLKKEVPYMSEVYLFKKNIHSSLPAVTHVDGTGRLQTVSEKNNYRYYHLLRKFNELTNVPIILNTSFNENEPIVRTPSEAIECFLRTKMDALVLENWLILRK